MAVGSRESFEMGIMTRLVGTRRGERVLSRALVIQETGVSRAEFSAKGKCN